MAAPLKVSKKVALGRDAYWIIPAVATLTAPTAVEINSASGLNVSLFVLGDQEGLGGDTGKVELPQLLGETSTSETLDTTKFTMPDFRFGFDPQATASANDKKAWALLKDGYTGFLVRRQNVLSAVDAAVTAGQFVDVAPVVGSVGIPKKSSTGPEGIYVFDVSFGITGTPSMNVAVV